MESVISYLLLFVLQHNYCCHFWFGTVFTIVYCLFVCGQDNWKLWVDFY